MKKKFLPFKDARKIVRGMGFSGSKEYSNKRKNYKISNLIPYNPDEYYREWDGWHDWLGIQKIVFMPFKKARKFIRSLKLKDTRAWEAYCKSGKKPNNIPNCPYHYKEYIDLYDWLGSSRDKRFYKVNDNYLKKWSHAMAYVLGFWFADGHIIIRPKGKRGSGYFFSISQNTKDRYILENMSNKMRSSYPIYDGITKGGSHYSKIFIRSEQIVNDIIRLGGKERKSLDVKCPNIPKKYLPDFLRGLWDGDGTVFYRRGKDNKMKGGASITSGSFDFVKKLHKTIRRNVKNIGGHIYFVHVKKGSKIFNGVRKKDSTYYCLSFSINEARRLRDFMYKNGGMCLKTKRLGFLDLGKIPEKINYLSYEDAARYVRKLHLKDRHEWKRFASKNRLPQNIPRCPYSMYKNKGWKGMNAFLDAPPRMLSFKDARKIVRKMGFKKRIDWRDYARSPSRPRNIPYSPEITYKNLGWISERDWFGIK